MMYDIAALQYMYGANFSKAGQNVTYSWSPTTGAGFVNGISYGNAFDNGAIFSDDLDCRSDRHLRPEQLLAEPGRRHEPGRLDAVLDQHSSHDLNYYAPSKPNGEIFRAG